MKKITIHLSTLFTLTLCLLFIHSNLKAQISLPYETGFDNAIEQAGWTEFKKAATMFSHWGIGPNKQFSSPNSVGHSYSPSSGITLTDNWFVSPPFSIPSGGTLDSIRYMCSGMSVPQIGDTIAIYLLNGSQDPSMATSKTLLFDIRDTSYVNDYTYKIKKAISLPSSAGLSYLAIRYRNSDCSSNWLSVNFDNIAISENTVGLTDVLFNTPKIQIFPNPATNQLTISTSLKISTVAVFNTSGKKVYSETILPANKTLDISSLGKGIYFIQFNSPKNTYSKKLIVQ